MLKECEMFNVILKTKHWSEEPVKQLEKPIKERYLKSISRSYLFLSMIYTSVSEHVWYACTNSTDKV